MPKCNRCGEDRLAHHFRHNGRTFQSCTRCAARNAAQRQTRQGVIAAATAPVGQTPVAGPAVIAPAQAALMAPVATIATATAPAQAPPTQATTAATPLRRARRARQSLLSRVLANKTPLSNGKTFCCCDAETGEHTETCFLRCFFPGGSRAANYLMSKWQQQSELLTFGIRIMLENYGDLTMCLASVEEETAKKLTYVEMRNVDTDPPMVRLLNGQISKVDAKKGLREVREKLVKDGKDWLAEGVLKLRCFNVDRGSEYIISG